MQKWKQTFMIMATVCIMVGCGSGSPATPGMNTVSIQKDGKIEQTIVEQFEQNYYNAEELAGMAKDKIDRYSDGKDNIVFESAEENDVTIIVKIVYQTGTDYTDFNNRELFCGTVAEASAQGYSLQDIISKDGEKLKDTEFAAIEKNHIVIIQTGKGEELDVNVYDKILYTSGNITLSGKNDAIIAAGEEDTISCIIW